MSLRTELDAIYAEYRQLVPREVAALVRDHPEQYPSLHEHLEWDDSVAGQKYREIQVQRLIRTIRVTQPVGETGQTRIRSWHSVPRPDGHTYIPLEDVQQDPFTRQLVLQQADREWRAMKARYGHMHEFFDAVRKDLAS